MCATFASARDGFIPGALHAPHGMLEFCVDPESPYYKGIFAPGKRFIFHCGKDWRGALATKTVQDMGLTGVCNLDGGLEAWKDAGGEDRELADQRFCDGAHGARVGIQRQVGTVLLHGRTNGE